MILAISNILCEGTISALTDKDGSTIPSAIQSTRREILRSECHETMSEKIRLKSLLYISGSISRHLRHVTLYKYSLREHNKYLPYHHLENPINP